MVSHHQFHGVADQMLQSVLTVCVDFFNKVVFVVKIEPGCPLEEVTVGHCDRLTEHFRSVGKVVKRCLNLRQLEISKQHKEMFVRLLKKF